MQVSKQIRELRKAKHMTQADLAEKIGVHDITIRRWEKGEGNGPSVKNLEDLASVLSTTIAELTGEQLTSSPVSPPLSESKSMGQRIRELRSNLGLTQVELAEKIGNNGNTISRWERGKIGIGQNYIQKLALALGSTEGYIKNGGIPAPSQNTNAHFSEAVWIPIVSPNVKICCGKGNAYPDEIEWETITEIPIPVSMLIGYGWQGRDKGVRILSVEGDSMEPTISDGDSVIFVDVEVSSGDIAVVQYQGKLMLRGVAFEKNRITLHAINPLYTDIIVNFDEGIDTLAILGKAIGIMSVRRLRGIW